MASPTPHARAMDQSERQMYGAIRARAVSSKGAPYLADAVFRLRPVSVDNLSNIELGRDGKVYIDFRMVEQWGIEQSTNYLIKIMHHFLRNHAERGKKVQDRAAWVLAANLEVNDDLSRSRMPLPEGVGIYANDIRFRGTHLIPNRSAEEYYRILEGHVRVEPADGTPSDTPTGFQGSAPSSDDTSQEEGKSEPGPETEQAAPEPDSGSSDGASDSADSASTSDDAIETAEVPENKFPEASGIAHDEQPWEDLDDIAQKGLSPVELEGLRQSIAEHVLKGNARGDIPGFMIRLAQKIKAVAEIPWEKQFGAAMRGIASSKAGNLNYSMSHPSRRYSDEVFIMPGMVQPVLNIGVVLDTSASMEDAMTAKALFECDSLLRRTRARVWVASVDAEVHSIDLIRTGVKNLKLTGGGGTDMGKGLEAFAHHKPKLDAVVVMTDMGTYWPDAGFRFKTIILDVSGRKGYTAPDWAYRHIRVS